MVGTVAEKRLELIQPEAYSVADQGTSGTRDKPARDVLLVCPSDNTLGALATILSENNEVALTAQNPKDAWEVIKAGNVGCVVLDLTAMTTDAWVLFRAARTCSSSAQIPFLFLAKKDFRIMRLENWGNEVARDSWLVLPCSAQLFLTAVRSLLDHRLHRETMILEKPGNVLQDPAAAPKTKTAPLGGREELHDLSAGMLSGQLGALDVTKIISMIEPLRLTGTLKLTDGKRIGHVHIIEGAVRHAVLNEIEGADALFLLFHLKSGSFRFEAGPPSTTCTIQGNTMSLLLEGLRQMDEAKQMVMAFRQRKDAQSGPAPQAPVAQQQ